MKQQSRLFYVFALVSVILAVVLVWNGMSMYSYERERIKKEIAAIIDSTAATVQNYNGSLVSNMAQMLNDEDYAEKVAFAAGATMNRGKLVLYFDEEQSNRDHMVSKEQKPRIDPVFFKTHNIHYKPEAVKNIHHYDSLLRRQLQREKLDIAFEARPATRKDTVVAGYTYVSRPFIIDFFQPKMYVVYYNIPRILVWKRVSGYIGGSLFLLAMTTAVLVFYYRAYKLNAEMAGFREELFSNIAHELKTPLSSLQLILDAAQQNEQAQAVMTGEHLQFARSELNRMKFMVDKMLSAGQMNKEQFELSKEPVQLDEVIRNAIDIMGIAATQKKAVIKYHGGPVSIAGNLLLLTNCITVLIDNALKYTEETPVIDIHLFSKAGDAVITVQDNGTGIAQEYHKKIFEPLFRVPNNNRHDVKGHGLGLSIAAQVVRLHNGSIEAGKPRERGSLFTIHIPLT